ncbi:MAG: putative nicotinamide phosphoribosyltransferase [Prokaryotic dsDNA virus sp.]|jgi:nicotinamide phosphoribosyltransferase|nr:MAG: putative nicotinamide phosphoribosyltransferase [Prokaryotic dsDNA virus sp.]|tara:strand:+ start:52685 stop:54256 length:1572 start_codon:yes stop_codon:yes gene_type:complete
MNKQHPMTQTDFYKVNHKFQYPEGTELVFSNFTPRSGKHFGRDVDGVVFVGLQKFILEHLIEEWNENFFNVPLDNAVGYYRSRIETSLGPDAIDFSHIEELHNLGYLPLRIRALPEGTIVPFKVPMFTVENTLPEFFWLTNYIETVMSAEIWKPSTVATIAREYRKILEKYAEETGAAKEMIPFSVHDFSMRGMSGRADAANSGVGHLLSFVGTDNIPAIDTCERYYGAEPTEELIGTSIPASEHSVMCAGGKEDEFNTYKRFITELYPNGLVGIVSDTWDLWKVLTEIAPALKDEIMKRDGKVVFRPDSGDPVDIICGLPEGSYRRTRDGVPYPLEAWDGAAFKGGCEPLSENVIKGAIQILWEQFGGTVNEKGYKELDSHVGLIYGDSITLERCKQICQRLKDKGFSSGNVVFGVGSYTYQMITRDTFGMAMKATYCEINGEGKEIFKDPVTDDGTKKSATGLLMVIKDEEIQGNMLKLVDRVGWSDVNSESNELKVVFEDGDMKRLQTLSQIRERVSKSF